MASADARAPGWYSDPDRLDTLRYWDGTGWTSRRRPRPAWVHDGSSLVVAERQPTIDGPVRTPELQGPAPPTAVPSRESTAALGSGTTLGAEPGVDTGGQLLGESRSGGDGGAGPAVDRGAGEGGGGGGGDGRGGGGGGSEGGCPLPDDSGRRAATRSRRKWMFLVGVAVLAAVAVGIAGEAMRPNSPGPRVLTDSSYVKLANIDCARTLPGLRPPDSGPFGQFNTPAQTAAQIEHASVGLDSLADRVRAEPAAPADQPRVAAWLAGWHRYADLGRQYATFLRQHGEANPGRLKDDIVREANKDDNFALANGLKQCTLFATPQPDPSNGF